MPDHSTRAEGGEARIYTASRAVHGPRWLERRAAGAPIVASWIDEWGEGQTGDWAAHWDRCLLEASTATALVLYAEDGESLVGALAEAGAALRAGVPVFYVGPDACIRKLARHRLLTRCASLDDAFGLASAPTRAATRGEEDPDPLERWLHNIQTYPRSGASQEAASGIRSHVHALRRQLAEGAAEEHEKQLTASQQEVARLRERLSAIKARVASYGPAGVYPAILLGEIAAMASEALSAPASSPQPTTTTEEHEP